MTSNKQLFQDIFGDNHIRFRCLGKNKNIPVHGYYNKNVLEVLEQANEQGCEIYFVVNSGGYKDEDITEINAVFIDLDCGKNEQGQYFPLDVAQKYKQTKLIELSEFKFKPSYIVETRNGLHVYWLVCPGATIDQFGECEARLIEYFNADKQVKNPARLMRVPGYYWCKDKANRFLIQKVQCNNVRYNIDDIISLPKVTSGISGVSNKKKYKTLFSIADTKIPNIGFIKDQNIEKLQTVLKPEPVLLHSHEEVYEYLKQQNLKAFLGLNGNTFSCVFHEDKNPSAGIIVNNITGHHIYHCFSSKCDSFKGTIIQVVERLTGLNRVKALRFLRKVYMIEYAETDWQMEQKAILEENQRFLISDEFKEFHPEVYQRIKNYIPELYIIIGFAKEKVLTENFSDNDNNALFYASLRHISKLCKKDNSLISDRIGLFAYLGLINKLRPEEIPGFLLNQAKHQAAKKNQKYLTGYYSIPSYCERTLSFSKQKSKEFKEKGFTMKGWSREMILRALGEDEANRVFPQMKGNPLPALNNKVTQEMEEIALESIECKGWTTEKEIIEELYLEFKGNKQYKEKQIKRMITEMLEKHGLERKRLTKDLKQKLGIICKGYPFIIYQKV